jgi:zinc transport system permease protein
VLFRGLVATVLDEEGSRVAGVPVTRLNVVVAVLAALTVAVSMRIVGILLIAALMVLPVIAANRVAWSLRSTFALSMAFGVSSVISGLSIAYYADLPPGGTIVLVAACCFLVTSSLAAFGRRR